MTITSTDAANALHDVDSARRHNLALFQYGLTSPFLLLWGALWIVAGAVCAISPDNADIGWLVVDVVGFATTGVLIAVQTHRYGEGVGRDWMLRCMGKREAGNMNMHRHLAGRAAGFTRPAASLFRAAAACVRRLLTAAVGLLWMTGPVVPAGAATPVVPLVTAHQYWDHHWFVWLPRHPVYECVEVMSIESTGGHYRAIWVFFIEREGGKRQVHFFDDRQIVEHFPGSHFRPIEYERSGAPGQGQSVRVTLAGLDDVPIKITVDLADRPLTRTGAGLTDQSGHSADSHFLLFHRDRNALARANKIRIGGRDYSFLPGDDPAGKHRFMAAYSAGIQVAAVYFGHWSFSRHESKLSASQAGLSFAVTEPEGGVRLTAPQPGYHNQIAVDLNAGGALTGYRHEAATNRLAFSLDGVLPLASDAPPAVREFAVHMNPDEPVARGEAVSEPMEGGRRVTWRMDSPPWTADYAFESIIEPNDSGHALTIRTLRR